MATLGSSLLFSKVLQQRLCSHCRNKLGCRKIRNSNVGGRLRHINKENKSLFHCVNRMSDLSKIPEPNFGLLFDIDGVISRGRSVIPEAVEAFRSLVDENGKFRVPTVFVTNAGNMMRHQKAERLSDMLGVQITEDQIVMSHSPLRMFRQFHDKHCLISGQGPIEDIAKGLGFSRVTTVDHLSNSFPLLDRIDYRKPRIPCAFEEYFPRIEAVLLFGEPIQWETSLQLITDVLMTNGMPCVAPPTLPYPHIPVLACNMDLQWMAESCLPRLGHGAFLVCLENLYKKITGKDMIYTALVGKPSEITYHHAEYCVLQHAKHLGIKQNIRHLYAIGDNINTDIYGANLYNHYLQKKAKMHQKDTLVAQAAVAGSSRSRIDIIANNDVNCEMMTEGITSCDSILVQTGVYTEKDQEDKTDHSPRDFLPAEAGMKDPTFCTHNVLQAVKLVFSKEEFL